jgi:hypothetical protein
VQTVCIDVEYGCNKLRRVIEVVDVVCKPVIFVVQVAG